MLLQNLKKKNDNVPTLQIDDEIAVLLSDDSLKTDLRFAALKFAGGIERRNVGLTKMLSKVHSAHFAFCNN